MKLKRRALVCKGCREKFSSYPLRTHTTTRAFCSEECLPEEVLDEYGAMDYVDFVYLYRDYLDQYRGLVNETEKVDLLDALELTMDQMGEYILCDAETVYVGYIQELFSHFDELYRAVESKKVKSK